MCIRDRPRIRCGDRVLEVLVNLEMSGLEASCLETEIGVDKSAVRLAISDCLQTF